MADITKCKGEGCKDRQNCYRFRAPDSEFRQAWFAETPGKDEDCDFHIPYDEED